jgi:hypothetical protein
MIHWFLFVFTTLVTSRTTLRFLSIFSENPFLSEREMRLVKTKFKETLEKGLSQKNETVWEDMARLLFS